MVLRSGSHDLVPPVRGDIAVTVLRHTTLRDYHLLEATCASAAVATTPLSTA